MGNNRANTVSMNDLTEELHPLGPAMRSLTEMQQRFVMAALSSPLSSQTEWAKAAGYSDVAEGAKVTACRLMQSPKIQAAIFEVSVGHFRAAGPLLAATGLVRIAANPEHKDHFRALESIADRVGMPKTTEHHVRVDDVRGDPGRLVERVRELAAQLGVDASVLLGARPGDSAKLIEAKEAGE